MPLTIHQDSIGNKYIGYAGDVANVASGSEIFNNIKPFLESFPSITSADTGDRQLAWATDGSSTSFGSNGTFMFKFRPSFSIRLKSTDAAPLDTYVDDGVNGNLIDSRQYGVATSNGVDMGWFGWDFDSSNNVTTIIFYWAGEIKGNSNISLPQTRSGIAFTSRKVSVGVKQGDSSTKRIHLDTEAGANHLIDCGTDTGRLYLIEDDGAGGDGGAVGYCENLYLSKKAGLTIGGFVTIDSITDGGSEQGIVVGQWGDNAHLIMRVYDGVS